MSRRSESRRLSVAGNSRRAGWLNRAQQTLVRLSCECAPHSGCVGWCSLITHVIADKFDVWLAQKANQNVVDT
uniref:Transposase n=1 Tax=Steinernema glaseri TaxID=37863 RepID=A0A1I8AX00_9BILA